MGIPDSIQTLAAAFTFGILFQAAISAVFVFLKGHAKSIFQNSRRLVLVIFLKTSALWAQVNFLSFTLPPTSPTGCQATIIVSTVADQIARIAIGGYLLWSVAHVSKSPQERYGLGTLLGLRVVAGTIFTVYTRPQFAPLCIAQSSLLPVSIAVIIFDSIIIGVLMIRILTLGLVRSMRDVRSSTKQEQSKALVYGTIGFFLWTAASVSMLLGIPDIILLLRTAIPAGGLQVLVLIISIYPGALVLPRREESFAPEARSPFSPPSSRGLNSSNESNGSPTPHLEYSRRGNLFVVNPSNTPRESPTMLPKIINDDSRGYGKFGSPVINNREGSFASRSAQPNENRCSSGIFGTVFAAPFRVVASAPRAAQLKAGSESSSANFGGSANILAPQVAVVSESPQKRSIFGRSKQPASNVRKLGISQPIMDDTQTMSGSPFGRVRTVDLATAAASERERRDRIQHIQLTATRVPPPPPLKLQSGSVRRKEAPPLRTMEPFVASHWDSTQRSSLSVALGANSTSSSLSPGHEEVRRRSPRQREAFGTERDTVVQEWPFITNANRDLPSRPEQNGHQISSLQQQTVMFVNNIEYDNPGVVRSIIDGAPKFLPKAKNSERDSVLTSSTTGSILNRPRPYRRQSEKDRVLFPSEPSPHYHRRSKSASSVLSGRMPIQISPESPFVLPRTPSPPPTTASKLKRLLPNDTRSMTVDEKISLMFPAPPGITIAHRRTSSVPSIPRIPSSIVKQDFKDQISFELEPQRPITPKAATIASFAEPIFGIIGSQRIEKDLQEGGTYRFSANTYRGLTENIRESWNSVSKTAEDLQISTGSPAPFNALSQSPEESSDDETGTLWESLHSPAPVVRLMPTQGNARSLQVTDYKITSPVADLVSSPQTSGTTQLFSPLPALAYVPRTTTRNESTELTSIILGSEKASSISKVNGKQESTFLDADQVLTLENGGLWHKRIGDELPAFSRGGMHTRTRKMPPPAPLILSSGGRQPAVVVRAPTPDSIDSSEKALQEIQSQLRSLDKYDPSSSGILLRQIPDTSARNRGSATDAHLGLLANLEKEIGRQEIQWHEMQRNFDRDSTNSELVTPLQLDITHTSEEELSQGSVSQPVTRQTRWRSSMALLSRGDDSASTTSTHSSENSRASLWQKRLAEAQMIYSEHAPEFLHNKSLNFLTFASGGQLGGPTPPESLDSGSDAETEFDSEADEESYGNVQSTIETPKAKTLWEPTQSSSVAQKTGHTWVRSQEMGFPQPSPEPPAKFLRPAPRKTPQSLNITSKSLWSMPATAASRPRVGLWGSRVTRPKSIVTRLTIQRPQRKSRRMTFLPDIVESPSPLPHKRESLGIFQFPWGEKSDCAVYEPPLPCHQLRSSSTSAINPTTDDRSRKTELEATEYPASFFDDYDEEYDELSETESDSDFDENTLWEIANLLNSSNVPSRNSLLPLPRIIEDYDDEDSEEESDDEPPVKGPIVKFMPIKPLEPRSPKPTQAGMEDEDPMLSTTVAPTKVETPVLKSIKFLINDEEILTSTNTPSSIHLPPNDSDDEPLSPAHNNLWSDEKMVDETESQEKSSNKPTIMWMTTNLENLSPFKEKTDLPANESFEEMAPLSTIKSQDVYNSITFAISPPQSPTSFPIVMWEAEHSPISTAALPTTSELLWTAGQQTPHVPNTGLFISSLHSNHHRTSSQAPAAISMTRKPRKIHATLPALTTQHLWSSKEEAPEQRLWTVPAPKSGDSQQPDTTPQQFPILNPDCPSALPFAVAAGQHERLGDVESEIQG